eukprot:8064347-Alexandrium_andersonii.AAC.1
MDGGRRLAQLRMSGGRRAPRRGARAAGVAPRATRFWRALLSNGFGLEPAAFAQCGSFGGWFY